MMPSRKLKIAYVVHDYNWTWGHARYTAEIATRAARQHEVHVFASRFDTSKSPGIVFHRVPAWRTNALTTILTFAASAPFAVRGDFDIIHAQGFCGGRRNLVTAHMCLAEWNAWRRRTVERLPWKERLFGVIVERLERRFYRGLDGSPVIAISRLTARNLQDHYGCTSPMHVIHHGANTQTFHPGLRDSWRAEIRRLHGFADGDCVFLHLGDLRKGARQTILALRDVPGAKLLLVARGSQEEYQRLALENQLEDRTVFAGGTEHPERYFGAADAFISATPYDPFGLVIVEAMASGLPVLASRQAGAAEAIEEGRNGWILQDPGSVKEIAAGMRRFMDNPALARQMGEAAAASVANRTWDVVAEETLNVYFRSLGLDPTGHPSGPSLETSSIQQRV